MAAFRTSLDVWPETCQKHRKIICALQVWLRWFWVSVWYGWSEADLPKLNKKGVWFSIRLFISGVCCLSSDRLVK